MIYKYDIVQRIESDFKENTDKAIEVLNNAISKKDYLKTDRVIRCIIFLAKGNIKELNRLIEVATYDTRDVMLWAEYENLDGESSNYKRIRDFNKTFDNCTSNVNE